MADQQTILVVDDDKFNLSLMREICENAGYRVIEARDGDEAIARTQADNPDLILLDIMMGAKDGFQVCREIRAMEANRETPIILVTAVDDLDSKVRGIELGADDYVTKPFRMFDLQTRIQSAIDARRVQRQARNQDEGEGREQLESKGRAFRVGGYRQLRWDLEYEYDRAIRYDHPLSCAILIIDRFEGLYTELRKKEAAGLVAAVVTVLQRTLRSVDRIYRIEDDVFIVIMPETPADMARIPIGRIQSSLWSDDASSTGPVSLTASMVALPDPAIGSFMDILRHLTDLLMDVKPDARNNTFVERTIG